jgi:hypothetical protein
MQLILLLRYATFGINQIDIFIHFSGDDVLENVYVHLYTNFHSFTCHYFSAFL